MIDLYRLLLFAFLLILGLGLVSDYIRNRTVLSEPFLAIVLGILIGPHVLGLVHLDAIAVPHLLIKEVALFTIALTVFETALRVPSGWLRANYRAPLLFVTLGMAGMWLSGSLVSSFVFGLPLWPALLLGAILTPTDPVLSDSVINSDLATRHVPVGLRYSISTEAGSNDGLALPFVVLPILVLEGQDLVWVTFGQDIILRDLVGGAVFGLLLGLGVGLANKLAASERLEAQQSQRLVTLAMTVVVVAAGELLQFSSVVAAFVAGLAFAALSSHKVIDAQEDFDASLKRAFELPIFVILGAFLPLDVWLSSPVLYIGFALAILLFRRPPSFLVLAQFTPVARGRVQAGYVAWFGPIGIAAVYYGALAQERLGEPFYLEVTSFVVFLSALLHGVTAEPVARRMRVSPGQKTQG